MENREKNLRTYSQHLRRNMTKEERHLWYDFLKTYPVPIHRQYAIEGYIVDFYCHSAALVIELDGSQHCTPEGIAYDRRRTQALEQKGLYVLRLSNLDVTREFRAVCEHIERIITVRTGTEVHKPSPRGKAARRSRDG